MGKKNKNPKKEEKEARKAKKTARTAAKKAQEPEKARKKAAREACGKEGAGSRSGLRVLSEERTAAREASGVAVHPSGILLVVDDEAGIFAHARSKGRMEVPIAEICGCEGVALDEAGTTLYVVSEDSRKVTAFAVRAKGRSITLGEPEKRGALPELGSKSNKGWEGLAVRPGVDVARLSLHAAAGPSATRSPSAPPHEVAGGASYLVASWQVRSSDAWHGDRGGRRRCRLRILGEEA